MENVVNEKVDRKFIMAAIKHSNNSNSPIEAILERDLSTIKSVERMMILEFLFEKNGELSFNDIISKTKRNESVLTYHISQLTKYNWLNMRTSEGHCYFKITEKAKDYLDIIHKYA